MENLIGKYKNKLVAIGECGLDYDRLNYSSKEEQLETFPVHFDLAEKYGLPLYLHNRNTAGDFCDLVRKNRDKFGEGVVHSFTDGIEELKDCLDLGLYIGVNGCSLKTEENIKVVKEIPLDRIMLETDCPYCEIRKSHAGYKYVKTHFEKKKKEKKLPESICKDRNEPISMMLLGNKSSAGSCGSG